ncbi:MAG: RluA family pseudouridine synthase [Bacteroidetes bacterium]|nr:RluA family pseudouridine synthase [Bacteroidota bacterium]
MNKSDDIAEHDEEDLYEHHRFHVDPGQQILRIDKYLIDRLPKTSRNRIQVAARNGSILVNGKAVKPNHRIKPNDDISIVMPYPVREIKLIPQNIELCILYEDSHLLVVNKPVGLVVHPGYGNYSGTLVNGLVYHFEHLPTLPNNYYGRPGLVHRIDKNTSGLLVVAKTEDALTNLAKQFFEKTTERIYCALVWGNLRYGGTVSKNIGRSPKNRKIMAVFESNLDGKPAITHFKPLENYGPVTLIECRLETGRTHQIRVHLQSIGHPLVNDPEYGGINIPQTNLSKAQKEKIEKAMSLLPGQALHAKTLGFKHPVSGEFLNFSSDLPKSFTELMAFWKKNPFGN